MFQLRSSLSGELSFRPFASFPVGFPNERATDPHNDILVYSPARRLAISPTKCHPRTRRATRQEAYENVIPSSRSPYRPSQCRFAFFELTTLQSGFIFRRGCIRFAEVCRRHDAPCI